MGTRILQPLIGAGKFYFLIPALMLEDFFRPKKVWAFCRLIKRS